MSSLFISHSSNDDVFVRQLQQALALHDIEAWIDSRELAAGNLLQPEIQKAIEAAAAFAVVVSPSSLQAKWVGKELRYALEVQKQRGQKAFPIIPISLNDTKLGVLEEFFDSEPLYIPASSAAGGIEVLISPMLTALGLRLPADTAQHPQPPIEPLEELVLELSDLKFHEQDGIRRASARARLRYEPATEGQREVISAKSWRFIAPIGPIEAEELRWYLEKFAIWPSHFFADRARKVEANLHLWGQLLFDAALPKEHTANVLQAWAAIDGHARRRFSLLVDNDLEDGAPEDEARSAKEAATQLMGLPWELLRSDGAYLFQGAKPVRVRRRIPNTSKMDVPLMQPPIRILLVTARPEDEACGYIDHRISALPLVEAMERLGGLVHLTLLQPPTLAQLSAELDRARSAGHPYHVVHFDGHGVYNRTIGLGGLCFESPQDEGKLSERRHETVYTDKLGPLLRDHRIPLVFLEACQTATADEAADSVASELLKIGVASVVAMSHSVLIETSRIFVAHFYRALAEGRSVGDAMLAGQRQLNQDSFRGHIFGAGELRLEDWFVPVLFQERADPQLFLATPSPQTQADIQSALERRMGVLPDAPKGTGFVGRSRELLALQRLLQREGYALLRGQGGEGKTALAAEFGRWMVRSQQVERAAFVSVEMHTSAPALLDALGHQLVGEKFSVAQSDLDTAIQQVERILTEQTTLIVVDNMESILLPPFAELPEALAEETRSQLDAILQLCARLNRHARFIFTSREPLPEPFAANRIELRHLHRDDAVKLVERVLNAEAAQNPLPSGAGRARGTSDSTREEIEVLVDAVNCHARTLALLAPSLQQDGPVKTRQSLVELMQAMQRNHPDSRENSLFASVELSLQRFSPDNRERAKTLAVFHGGVQLDVLRAMTGWESEEVGALAGELLATGLATLNPYNHLSLNPALTPWLRQNLSDEALEEMTSRWIGAMAAYVNYLYQQLSQNTQIAATLTLLELPNLFALLDLVQQAGDAENTIDLTTLLYSLLQRLGKPKLLHHVGQILDAAAATLGEQWNHAAFNAAGTRIEQQLASGQLQQAYEGAQTLLQRVRSVGETAYGGADYDLAGACWLLGRVLKAGGASEQALPLLHEARQRFEAVAQADNNKGAEGMASACLTEQGSCLLYLGRYDEAAMAYEAAIQLDEQREAARDVAVGKGQLGTVRMQQRRYPEALAAFAEARESFSQLDEPGSVAISWHQTGMVYQQMNQPEAAEDAYRKSLAIKVQQGDAAGQASTLNMLGNLYDDYFQRSEEAAAFYRQAADIYGEIHDTANEGRVRNNLADTLKKLRRYEEARQEIKRAIACDAQFGHAAEPWKTWNTLADIETECGHADAAAEARGKAHACYLAYRRDGGENHNGDGRLALAIRQMLQSGQQAEAAELLQQLAAEPRAANMLPFTHALQAILTGSRDPALANAPDLDHTESAEILLLIEALQQP